MPPAAPIIAGAVISGVAVGVASGLTAGIIVGFISLGIGMISMMMAPKPPKFPEEARGRTLNIRSAAISRTAAYGRVKVGGLLAFIDTTGADHKFLHVIQILASHKITGPVSYWLDDFVIYPSTLDGSGLVTEGRYHEGGVGLVRIKFHNGDDAQAADTDLVSEIGQWTTAHQLKGVSYVYWRLEFNQKIFSGMPNFACELKGKKVLDLRDSVTKFSDNGALVFNDWIKSEYGLAVAIADIDDTLMDADANTSDEIVAGLSDAKNNTNVSQVSFSENLLLTLDDVVNFVDGDQVRLTTTGTLPTGLAVLTDYYVFVERGFISKADDDSTVRNAAISLHTTLEGAVQSLQGTYVAQVTFSDAGSGVHTIERVGQSRYTANGLVPYVKNPGETQRDLESAIAGVLSYVGGKWKLRVGAYAAPTITINEDDMRGAISVQTRRGRRGRFNAVRGVYLSPANNYALTDYPPFISATFLADDDNFRSFQDLPLPFTNSAPRATRLAKIALVRHRQEITASLKCKLSVLREEAGGRINVDNDEFGWSGKPFDIVDLTLIPSGGDETYIGCDLMLRETASTVFDWNAGADESPVDPAPNTNLRNPFFVPAPTNLNLASGDTESFTRSDGTVFTSIKVTWDAPASNFVTTGGRIEIQFKRSVDSDWMDGSFAAGDAVIAFILNVENGTDYDVRIRAVSNIGRFSAFQTVLSHTVGGKTGAPGAVFSFAVGTDAVGVRVFRWVDNAPPDDLDGYKIRFETGLGGTDWDTMADLHVGLLTQSPWETNELAAGPYSFGIRPRNTTGNLGTGVFISATLPDQNLSNALAFLDEKGDGFKATKISCHVGAGGNLEADSTATIGDLPATIGALAPTIGALGGLFVAPIRYITAEINLGGDVNFFPIVTLGSNGADTIEMQVGSSADGSADGPGSPSNPWQPLDRTDGRYVRFRVTVDDAESPSIQLIISALSWLIDAPITVEVFDDVDTSSETAVWFESLAAGHFRIATRSKLSAITIASLVLQNVGAGWTWELITKQASIVSGDIAAEFKVYNSSSVLADAVIDVELRGPKA